MPGRNIRLA